jgi:hypothetical protein
VTVTQGASTQDVAADTATADGGATLTKVSGGFGSGKPQWELKIPSLGIDQNVTVNSATDTPIAAGADKGKFVNINDSSGNNPFHYVNLGQWEVLDSADKHLTNLGAFAIGYQTPPGSVPTSGSATYQTVGGVTGAEMIEGGSTLVKLSGDASLTANFAAATVSGSMTNMTATPQGGSALPWNNLSIAGTISGASITGTTSITNTPNNATSLTGTTLTGSMAGSFYGPAADEVGLVWSVQDSNKSVAAGAFGAGKAAPSDRRLKRDIEAVRQTPDGLNIYRYRYLGDERMFEGVIAQELLAQARFAHAVFSTREGLLLVDYGALGFEPADFENMRAAGFAAVRTFERATVSA